jgi:hypothetical protein
MPQIERWTCDPVGATWLVALIALALVLLLFVGPARDKTTRRRRQVLTSIRLLVVVLALFALLRPTIVRTTTRKQAATLVLLVDRSRSMLVGDEVGGKSRWQVLETALADAQPALADLAQDVEVKIYGFDETLHPIELANGKIDLGGPPDGKQSAYGWAIDEVLKLEAGKRLVGLVVLGDGAQRTDDEHALDLQIAARRMRDLGAPAYAVPLGQARGPGQLPDFALDELLTNEQVFVKNQLPIDIVAHFIGMENQTVPVQVVVETSPGEEKVVSTTPLVGRPDGEQVRFESHYVPEIAGEIKLTVKAAQQRNEQVITNNQISTFVTVLKGGLNVLYLDGALVSEQKFLRWSLEGSPDIQLDLFHFRGDKPETRPKELDEAFEPGKYDVYIIGDLDSAAFKPEQLAKLADTIEHGAGFIMLGGLHSFGPGGYGRTALADVLPIEIGRLERQNFGEKIRDDLHVSGRVRMLPTRDGASQYVMLLAPRGKDNRAAWAQLPPLDGANRFAGVKRQGRTLVLAESDQKQPLLVAGEWGDGRVLAMAGDSTWHWWMEGHEAAHQRFWRQVVLWLARKDQSAEGNVWIRFEKRRYRAGSKVEFTLGANSPQGEPLANATFDAEIELPGGGHAPARLRRQSGEVRGTWTDTIQPGDYTLRVTAKNGSEVLGTTQGRFLIYAEDLELERPVADRTALENLTRTASAEDHVLAPEQLPGLLAALKEATRQLEVATQVKETLWDTWPLFLAFVGLLIVEWVLRKKWGLV